jgi:acyl-CoA thioester hydrolase
VGVRVARLGNKSLTFEYQVEDEDNAAILATAETVMVAYNYHTQTSVLVSPTWREKIAAFEVLSA